MDVVQTIKQRLFPIRLIAKEILPACLGTDVDLHGENHIFPFAVIPFAVNRNINVSFFIDGKEDIAKDLTIQCMQNIMVLEAEMTVFFAVRKERADCPHRVCFCKEVNGIFPSIPVYGIRVSAEKKFSSLFFTFQNAERYILLQFFLTVDSSGSSAFSKCEKYSADRMSAISFVEYFSPSIRISKMKK